MFMHNLEKENKLYNRPWWKLTIECLTLLMATNFNLRQQNNTLC